MSTKDVLNLAKTLFEALVPPLVEQGVTSAEVEGLLRAVFVRQVAKTLTQPGRRTNVSEISIRTGIDRHTVARLLKAPLTLNAASARLNSAGRVLQGWRSDPEYSKNRQPRVLEIGGPRSTGTTVWSLVKRYAPGVWPRLVIDELIRLGHVTVRSNGTAKCKTGGTNRSNSLPTGRQPLSKAARLPLSESASPSRRRIRRPHRL